MASNGVVDGVEPVVGVQKGVVTSTIAKRKVSITVLQGVCF